MEIPDALMHQESFSKAGVWERWSGNHFHLRACALLQGMKI
jgi:hypothetical protein